jgi:long-subunit acyl-CoA synthetase (AMP-forming)
MEGAVQNPPAATDQPRTLAARTMCEAFQLVAAERRDDQALRTIGDGVTVSFGEYAQRVTQLAGAFHALGVRRGHTVAFMLANRPEFHLLDTAVMHLGATPFSIYNTSSVEQIAYLLEDAGNRTLVVEAAFLDRARTAIEQAGSVEQLIVLDEASLAGSELSLADLERLAPGPEFDFEASWRAVEPDDVLTLIYTSGTTGPPKGVQITHANEMSQCESLLATGELPATRPGMIISYLPVAHIADRGLVHYGQMVWGHTITTCPDPAQVFAHAAECRPTRFGGVPRVWEKLKAALEAGFATEPDEARREAIRQAIELGVEKVRLEQAAETVPEELANACQAADERIFAAVRAKLGFDRCQHFMIGAAPAPRDVFEFFAAIGIPICEVWGMSELSCVATLVPRAQLRFGSVGKALPGVELRIADDGELLCRGGIVMAGYRNQPQKTGETIDADGWVHTGDIGVLDEDGFLRVIDRKKELIINAAGKNMSPANIEQQIKQSSPLIGQTVAIGDSRPYNVALIVLDPDASAAFASEHGLSDASPAAMAAAPAVQAEVARGVAAANERLSRVEQIKRFTILPCDWAPAGDELTPTMKLKRKPIAAKYADEIEALYVRP